MASLLMACGGGDATPLPTAVPNPNLDLGDEVTFRRPVTAYPDRVTCHDPLQGASEVLIAGSLGVVIDAVPDCGITQGGLYLIEIVDGTEWWVYGGDIRRPRPSATAMATGVWSDANVIKRQEDTAASLPTPLPTPDPDYLTAGELLAAFEDNALAATRDYEGKILLVSGTIEAIDREFDGTPFIGLTSSSGPIQFTEVKCLFSEEHISEILSLSSGAGITLRGKFSEFALFDIVLLTDCRVSTL